MQKWFLTNIINFHSGATLGKGVNRGLATLLAGALAVGAHHLANLSGHIGEPIVLGFFVFLQGKLSHFSPSFFFYSFQLGIFFIYTWMREYYDLNSRLLNPSIVSLFCYLNKILVIFRLGINSNIILKNSLCLQLQYLRLQDSIPKSRQDMIMGC